MAERSPDEVDTDVDAERPLDEEEVDDVEVARARLARSDREPDEIDVDAERAVDEHGDDLYEEQPDLGDFEDNLNA